MIASHASASIGRWSQPASDSHVMAASASRPVSVVSTAWRSSTGTRISRSRARRVRSRSGISPALPCRMVEGVPEQVALPRLPGGGRRVREVEDVTEPVALGVGVVLEERALVVEPLDGVGDAALHRLRQAPAVPRGPVAEQLARLVGALEDAVDGLTGVAGRARVDAGLDELGGADERGGPHVPLAAQPAEQARGPHGVLDGELPYEGAVAVVAVVRRLVEGVRGDEVRDGEQEQFAARVAQVSGRALVRARPLARHGGDRRPAHRAGAAGVEACHEAAPLRGGEAPRAGMPNRGAALPGASRDQVGPRRAFTMRRSRGPAHREVREVCCPEIGIGAGTRCSAD